MTRRIDEAMEAEIVRLWRETDQSTSMLAERFGVSPNTVRRTLARHGCEVMPAGAKRRRRRVTTPEQDAEMVARYLTGEPAQQIADDYGLKFSWSVAQRVIAAGHPTRGRIERKPITPELGEEILRLRAEGLTLAQIAQRMPMSEVKIGEWLRRHGGRTNRSAPLPRIKTSSGYMAVKVHEDDPMVVMAPASGYVREHRLVMARHIGRPLLEAETVHHINGDRTDNRIENLQLRRGDHGQGVRFQCQSCGSHDVAAVPIGA